MKALEELILLVLYLVFTEARVKSYRTGQITLQCMVNPPALHEENLPSSITFDPGLREHQVKNQQNQLFKSFHLAMGKASVAFTSLLSINFPKANFKGMCGGNSARAPKSVCDGGLSSN